MTENKIMLALLERYPPMHEALAFDTQAFYQRLLSVDFTEHQADSLVSARVLIHGVKVDTRRCFERLMEADITEQQAEALLEGWLAYRATLLAAWNERRRP